MQQQNPFAPPYQNPFALPQQQQPQQPRPQPQPPVYQRPYQQPPQPSVYQPQQPTYQPQQTPAAQLQYAPPPRPQQMPQQAPPQPAYQQQATSPQPQPAYRPPQPATATTPVQQQSAQYTPPPSTQTKPQQAPAAQPQYAAYTPPVQNQDVQDNKAMGVLSYLWFLWLVPLISGKHKSSAFAKFHMNQGLTVILLWMAFGVVAFLLSLIRVTRTQYMWGIAVAQYSVSPWWISLITSALSLGITVLCLIGIVAALKGEKKPLPLVGGLFNFFK